MKVSKILAGMSAAAILASVAAVSASAEEIPGLPKYAPVTLDGTTNMIQVELASFEGITEANISSVDFAIKPHEGNWGEGWFGGGFGIGVQTTAKWEQLDVAGDGTDEIATGWAAAANGGASDAEYAFTWTLAEGTKTKYLKLDEDPDSATYGQMVSAGPLQFGYWWGSNPAIDLTKLVVNFDDGSSITVIDATATAVFDKAEYVSAMNKIAREKAAADALAALQEKIDALTYKDAISDMDAAADALTNAKSVLDKADAAKAEIDGLEQVLADAEEAFAALEADDTADRDAYEAAKASVETAKTEVDAAKAKLQAAIEAYDKATADKLAEKDKDIADKQAEIDALKAQLEEAKKQNETDAATIKDLEDQITAKDEEIETLKAEKAELQKKLDEALANANKPADDNSGSTTNTNNNGKDNTNPGTSATAGLAFAGISLAGVGTIVASKKRK